MKKFDEIDRLFQAAFDGFEPAPDPSVKENIDRVINSGKKRRRPLFFFLSFFIGAIASGAVFYSISFSDKMPLAERDNSSLHNNAIQTNQEKNRSNPGQPGAESSFQKIRSVGKPDDNKTIAFGKRTDHVTGNEKNTSADNKDRDPENRTTVSMEEERIKSQTDTHTPITYEKNPADPSTKKDHATLDTSDDPVADTLGKSILEIVAEKNSIEPVMPISNKWYLTAFAGWEGERTRPFEGLDSNGLSGGNKEFARVHSSSFYGKIEMNRNLTGRLDIIMGVGFRSAKITQYGSLYAMDSMLVDPEFTSAAPDSFAYFVKNETGEQIFRVHSVLLPIGLAYSLPIGQQFDLRLSAGTEFSYGWLTDDIQLPNFSNPQFRPFGWNVWMRPEVHYAFGKFRLIGFANINHALFQQLKWDVTTHRNPSFGGGLGLRVDL